MHIGGIITYLQIPLDSKKMVKIKPLLLLFISIENIYYPVVKLAT